MKKIRFIPRLDLKNNKLIKPIKLEGLRVIGDPYEFALKYYNDRADEILLLDTVASLYSRDNIISIINDITKNIFIPITVCGGVRNLKDAELLLKNGADKIALNTGAVQRPELVFELTNTFGSSTVILSIEAVQVDQNKWEVYINSGRDKTGIDVFDWIKKMQDFGIGECLITSVNKMGTGKGFDINLLKKANKIAKVPIIASGGMGNFSHLIDLIENAKIDAIAISKVIHYGVETISSLKSKYYDFE